jgi:hypothetical protein
MGLVRRTPDRFRQDNIRRSLKNSRIGSSSNLRSRLRDRRLASGVCSILVLYGSDFSTVHKSKCKISSISCKIQLVAPLHLLHDRQMSLCKVKRRRQQMQRLLKVSQRALRSNHCNNSDFDPGFKALEQCHLSSEMRFLPLLELSNLLKWSNTSCERRKTSDLNNSNSRASQRCTMNLRNYKTSVVNQVAIIREFRPFPARLSQHLGQHCQIHRSVLAPVRLWPMVMRVYQPGLFYRKDGL